MAVPCNGNRQGGDTGATPHFRSVTLAGDGISRVVFPGELKHMTPASALGWAGKAPAVGADPNNGYMNGTLWLKKS